MYLVNGIISEQVKNLDRLTNITVAIVVLIIQMIVSIGLTKIAIKFASNQKGEIKDLYNHYPLFFKYLAGSILTGIITVIGFILLIIPGIIFSLKLQFVSYLIIDKGMGPIEAIKRSWAMTKGNVWNLFLLSLITTGLNILGALALLIGLLWTIPTTSIATAYVYKKLSQNTSS